jgi:glycosyltransferase involved in cell wall biosynthesis
LGILSDAVVVGFVGRLVAEKGIPELLRAWQLRETDFELLILGPPDPTKSDALSQSIIDEAEGAGVRFLGHRDHIEEFYRALDVFVLPSHREGFPRAAMEAAASGLAIVATDIRGCREVVDHRLNGLLVPTGDSVRLAAAIDQLVMDPVTRTSMGEQGRKKARAEFDERVVVDRVIGAYRDAASRKGLMELNHALASSTDETNARD